MSYSSAYVEQKLTGATYSTPAHLKLHVNVPSGEEAPDPFDQNDTSVTNNKTIVNDLGIMIKCTAIDDGYLYLSRYGKVTGSNRCSEVPVLRYEVCIFSLHEFTNGLISTGYRRRDSRS